jgi:hypothetical protein
MEPKKHRIKRKVAKPKTPLNTLKKRLSSEHWKANVLILTIFLVAVSVVSYFLLAMPMPKSMNSKEDYEPQRKEMESIIREREKKKQ